ncbi:MAG: Asp-tRNA(Asn)/Glu-tRNA(Gln) amidotransferase subunit GatB [Gemmatimonadaceae bacterium]
MTSTTATAIMDGFEMVVGLEVHVQLRTVTKAFCGCSAQYGSAPNANTCPTCLALPGALPVLNGRAVEYAVRAALALDCAVHATSVFARKNYFYPDLPKGYQISQYDRPLATDGYLDVAMANGEQKRIRITRLHMEEDAGKSIHDRYAGATAIDLNRSGVPLIEIVTEPDMRSAEEAGSYLRVLKQVLEYTGVSDVSMEEGSLRVDANVSARRRGDLLLGTKTEVKNMNSFSGVERALDAEFARQCALLIGGGKVQQQTMLWDGARGEVRMARSKEASHDYRYFPEPDLLPLVLTSAWIEDQRSALPEMPARRRDRLAREYKLCDYDATALTASPPLADYFEAVARAHGDGKTAANWVLGEVQAARNADSAGGSRFGVRPSDLVDLLTLIASGTLSNTTAKVVFSQMLKTGDTAATIVQRDGLSQVGDDSTLHLWIDQVLAEHPDEARRFMAGERKLQGVLIGFVMKKSKGRADPKRLNQLLASRAG